jgi:hypothetical protein
MANVRTSIDIEAPVQDVWGLVTDRLGEWVSIHREFPEPPPQQVEQGTGFEYENEFRLPAGEIGEAASGVVSGYAAREAGDSLSRLERLAEA